MSAADAPLVSIITPSFNRAHLLSETIASVVSQDFTDWEMVIIDDGSTDNTAELVEEYSRNDPRIRWIRQENGGICRARNHGIEEARGRYLAFIDSDDCYCEGALGKLVEAMQGAPDSVKMVCGDLVFFNMKDQSRVPFKPPAPLPRPGLFHQMLFLKTCPVVLLASLIEKQAFVEVGFFDESYRSDELTEFCTRFVQHHDLLKVDAEIYLYRRHDGEQLSNNHAERRYCRDRLSYEFFYAMPLSTWFPKAQPGMELARRISFLARAMLKTRYPAYDTALSLLRLAEEQHHEPRREAFIARLEAAIPKLLMDNFASDKRISLGGEEVVAGMAN